MPISSISNPASLLETKASVAEYNDRLKKEGRSASALDIRDKEDLKKQYQNFIKLLMTQLQHQDPSDPMKNEDFVTQLVQFSHLEQALRSNDTQSKVLGEQQISHLINSSGFIGKEIEFASDSFYLNGEGVQKLAYTLPGGVSAAQMIILDNEGHIVNTYDVSKDQGRHAFDWDGKNHKGERVQPGEYAIKINARDQKNKILTTADKKEYKIPTSVYGIVPGVIMDKGVPKIKTGGSMTMPLGAILSIQSAAEPATAA